jgi:hypothetical protein
MRPAQEDGTHRHRAAQARYSLTIRSALLRQMLVVGTVALAPAPAMNSELSNWRATSSSEGGTTRKTPLRPDSAPNGAQPSVLNARIAARAAP